MPTPVSTETPSDAQAPATGLGVRGISLAYHPSHPVIENLSTAITPGAVTRWGQVVFAPLMMSLSFSVGVCPFKTMRGRRLRRSWMA